MASSTDSKGRIITEKIWLNESVKWEQCIQQYQQNNQTAFIAWFDETFEKLTSVFSLAQLPVDSIFLTRQALHHQVKDVPVFFVEHYPWQEKEEEFYTKFQIQDITVFLSLDEPLFQHFASAEIKQITSLPHLKKDQPLENDVLFSSLKKAQEIIASHVTVELHTRSQADWLMKNFTA